MTIALDTTTQLPTRRRRLGVVVVTLWCLTACAIAQDPPSGTPAMEVVAPTRPERHDNVLLIVADDVSMERIGAFAHSSLSGPTPTIDRLAARGIRFSRAYSNPVCSPTRATILTGLYGFRTGIGSNIAFENDQAFELRATEFTLPKALAMTHRSAAVGKWHLGTRVGHGDQHPIVTGFEFFAGTPEQLGGLHTSPSVYFDWQKTVASAEGAHRERVQAYSTSEHVDDALAFIEEFGQAPWFLYLAFHAPHTPFHVPPEELITLEVDDTSPWPAKHRAMVEAMDTEMARLLHSIPADVLARTWVVFVGDNGSHGLAMSDPAFQHKAKSTGYEAGVNVPLIIAGPGVVEGGRAVDALVNTTDLFATVLDMAGVDLPDERQPQDSKSLMPYLREPARPPIRETAYAELFSPNGIVPRSTSMRVVIGERYKLVVMQPEGGYPIPVLFDLQDDPNETRSLLIDDLSPELRAEYNALAEVLLGLLRTAPSSPQDG